MKPRDALLRVYQQELAQLRESTGRFAMKHPKVSQRLGLVDQAWDDPHTALLMESFAFLTARVQHGFQQQLPEISTALLGLIAPHLVEPMPSMAIARLVPEPGAVPPGGLTLPQDTPLFTKETPGKASCWFRTRYPTTLWPVEVKEVRLRSIQDFKPLSTDRGPAQAVLSIRLESQRRPFASLEMDTLRLFLGGGAMEACWLYELLAHHALGLAVLSGERDSQRREELRLLPGQPIRPVGFAADEAMLPGHRHGRTGHRLLQEYCVFPEKFLFFDLEPGRQNVQAAKGNLLELAIPLDVKPDDRPGFSDRSLLTGCTPVVNLFPRVSEPIRVDHRRTEYRLVPDAQWESTTEVHSIQDVRASTNEKDSTGVVSPMFAFNHAVGQRKPRTFWSARREPARGEQALGTDLYLSFLDLDFNPSVPDERTLYARILCTNRHLASRLPSGAQLQWAGGLPLQEVRLLKAPTPQRDPPLGGSTLWQFVSQVSFGNHSITALPNGVEVLREMIRRHGYEGDEALEDQLQGLLMLGSREFVHPMTADGWRGFCRGLELVLTVDESRFVGGSALLLSAVLNHFFGLNAPVNTLVRLTLEAHNPLTGKTERRKQWPPMSGEMHVL
ncbi:type VI secretion system baseplate subunit TssF [Corallococcus exiguus]|uniref:type VI secretion system baseplate subunit TssF n=1 Tax=Corallococcus TaxID=83461 RepID=UPI00131570E4|nr:type VI secretion system baseplate subunit TssF [Corallococcus sp. AB030]NNC20845.1 type VI secretion system baseplate subunit TssF [Corallococcus exiguus]